MKWRNLQHYVEHHECRYGNGKKIKYPEPAPNRGKDSDYVAHAIFCGDIRPFREHKVDYPDICEFYIHKRLLYLQREFMIYDTSYTYVREWAAKRYYNTLNEINKLRQRYGYYKPLKL